MTYTGVGFSPKSGFTKILVQQFFFYLCSFQHIRVFSNAFFLLQAPINAKLQLEILIVNNVIGMIVHYQFLFGR